MVLFLAYLESIGLAAAKMLVRAFSLQMMPHLATESVCCFMMRFFEKKTKQNKFL